MVAVVGSSCRGGNSMGCTSRDCSHLAAEIECLAAQVLVLGFDGPAVVAVVEAAVVVVFEAAVVATLP